LRTGRGVEAPVRCPHCSSRGLSVCRRGRG
jgi:DNA-directed RNA polymerase subunit RPC12/RpoP